MIKGETHLNGKVTLYHGDSRDVLKQLPDNSIDSVVTDPPYALVSIVKRFGGANAAPAKGNDAYQRASAGFMGKQWDTGETAFAVEFWAEVMRVLKPGGHVIAASGTRTYHRLAVAIEDAGFEIRDCLMWHYGSGFPKSHNVFKQLAAKGEACTCHISKLSHHHATEENLRRLQAAVDARDALSGRAQSDVRRSVQGEVDRREGEGPNGAQSNAGNDRLRGLRLAEGNAAGVVQASEQPDLQPPVQRRSAGAGLGEARAQGGAGEDTGKLRERSHEGREQPGVEGRRYAQATTGELQGCSVCEGAGMGAADGAEGRLHHGASSRDGADVRLPADTNGGGAPSGPRSIEQRAEQSGIVADECGPQAWGGWPVCDGCGKPIIPEGLGTALKPACEPWVLARKPLGEKTVAANVLAHGCGALNIDGCRVGDSGERNNGRKVDSDIYGKLGAFERIEYNKGRFPANVIHDGSDEVLAGFPDVGKSPGTYTRSARAKGEWLHAKEAGTTQLGFGDSGSAARFFYSAKADAMDRVGSKHPTVKPVDLMQYLCRLITPPGGVVLDPFAGSGSTGEAAWREGFRCVLIEREEEYAADIRRRLELADLSPETKAAILATRKADEPLGGLFAALGDE